MKSTRLNFDSFWEAAQVVLVCLIGDEWNLLMVNTMRAFHNHVSVLYFAPLIIIGQFFLMNIFLAVHIKVFEECDAELEKIEMEQENIIAKIKRSFNDKFSKKK